MKLFKLFGLSAPPDDVTILKFEVCKFANILKNNGAKKGDRICLYMPMVPELAISMFACARIGATHTVVFSGFSSASLRGRIEDSKSKIVITSDGGYRRGKIVKLKEVVDEAIKNFEFVVKKVKFTDFSLSKISACGAISCAIYWFKLSQKVSFIFHAFRRYKNLSSQVNCFSRIL